MFNKKGEQDVSQDLQNALDAMRKINNATRYVSKLASFNGSDKIKTSMTYIGKQKAVGIKKGDTVTWEYGGIPEAGV